MTRFVRRPYWKVFFNVAIVWWVIAGLATVAAWTVAPGRLMGLDITAAVLVSVGSGLVAAMAILPGLIVTMPIGDDDRGELSRNASIERVGQAFFAGMLIRLTGTVALFMVSSYYLLPSDPGSVLASIAGNPMAFPIAAWVLLWHAILLLAEVISLANEIKT